MRPVETAVELLKTLDADAGQIQRSKLRFGDDGALLGSHPRAPVTNRVNSRSATNGGLRRLRSSSSVHNGRPSGLTDLLCKRNQFLDHLGCLNCPVPVFPEGFF
jgi:hypothetical protein